MKKIIYISTIALALLSACSDSFIELAPISEGNAESFYQTPADFEQAVIAIYNNLQSADQYGSNDTRYGGGFYSLMEVRADDVTDGEATSGIGKSVYEIDAFQDNTLNDIVEGSWKSIFKTIFDANTVITRIENIEIEASLKNQYLGEARFLRALSYFNAVRLWGKLPIITKEISPQEAQELSRQPVEQIYQLIKDDLLFAVQNLPISFPGQEGRATSEAAKAFLGKVYLTQEKWKDAMEILQQVTSYQLLEDINDVFALDNELNNEIIFSVRFKAGTDDEGHLGFGTPEYPLLLNEYEATDDRLTLLDKVAGSNDTYPRKFFEDGSSQLGRDFPVLRYADVLLMKAEALNELAYEADGEALSLLNEIRSRSNASTYTVGELATQSEFRNVILKERRLELALELHRWFDLLRTNTALTAMENAGISVQNYQLLYPIPQNEINIYNNPSQFPQNDGYN